MLSILSHLYPRYPRVTTPLDANPPPQTLSPTLISCPLTQASTNYKEAFALFDKRGNGRVALQSLGDLLRACGQNPTLAEIKDLEKSVGGDCKYTFSAPNRGQCTNFGILSIKQTDADVYVRFPVDFDAFSKVLNRPGGFRDPGEPEEYCRGFQVFDKDMTGFIGVGQLRYSTFSLSWTRNVWQRWMILELG